MPDMPGMTRAQTLFLRAFRDHPLGPPPAQWPAPCVFRRWLRRPKFRAALASVRDAMRFQADLHLAGAAAAAAHALQATLASVPADPAAAAALGEQRVVIAGLAQLLKLSHLRQRFAAEEPVPPASNAELLGFLRRLHQNTSIQEALAYFHEMRGEEYPARSPPDRQDLEPLRWRDEG